MVAFESMPQYGLWLKLLGSCDSLSPKYLRVMRVGCLAGFIHPDQGKNQIMVYLLQYQGLVEEAFPLHPDTMLDQSRVMRLQCRHVDEEHT